MLTVKHIQGQDMQQIKEEIKKDYGADAVILDTKEVRQKGFFGIFKKPMVEVSIAYEPDKTPAARKMRTPDVSRTQAATALARQSEFARAAEAAMSHPQASARGGKDAPARQGNEFTPINPLTLPSADAGKQPAAASAAPPASAPAQQAESNTEQQPVVTAERLDDLDSRISSLDRILGEFMDKFAFLKRDVMYDYSDGVREMLERMLDNQVREELAHSIAKEAETILKKDSDTDAGEVVKHLVREHLGTPESITHKRYTRKNVLILGPTGVGKTTSIVKLAAEFAIERQKKVGIINTDTYRVGAQEQLQTYADILDIPIHMVYNEEELRDALSALDDRDVIFIDTAGKKPGDEDHRAEIENIIKIAKPEDILLCISAATSFASVREIIDSYSFAGQYKLVITKLDETKSRGMILNACWYSKRALTYVTVGQSVPDDIAPADAGEIAEWVLYG